MREILFRGKRIDNGEWVYGSLVIQSGEWLNKGEKAIDEYWIYGKRGEIYLVDSSTVGQDTGLTDKNGEKIFEGDYVITKFGRPCRVRRFVSAYFCGIDFLPLNTKYRPPTEYDMYRSDNLEVIGNIHDNFELLEGQS